MRKSIFSVLSLLLVSACLPPSRAQEKLPVLANPYYPLEVGNKWRYRVGDQKVVARVDKLEAIDMKKGDKTEKVAAYHLTIGTGDRQLSEYVAVLPDGIYRFAGEDKELSPPVRFLKLNATAGESWDCQMTVQGTTAKGKFTASQGEVTVPAGTFKAFIVSSTDFQIGTQKMAVKTWFADHVGIVKQETRYGTLTVTMELEKFEPATK